MRCLGGEDGARAEEEVVADDVALPEPGLVSGDVDDGTREGYEFSADGDRAHIAKQGNSGINQPEKL